MSKLKRNLIFVLVLVGIFSCTDTVEEIEEIDDGIVTIGDISAKWVVVGSDVYEAFEFNQSGHYIVRLKSSLKNTEPDKDYVIGEYEIKDDSSFNLKDFGDLTVTSLEGESIAFSVRRSGDTEDVNLAGTKEAGKTLTPKNELLCRSWEFISFQRGDSILILEEHGLEGFIIFSIAGSYVMSFKEGSYVEDFLEYWDWDENEEGFFYSVDNVQNGGYLRLLELSDTSLKVSEIDVSSHDSSVNDTTIYSLKRYEE